MASKFKKKIISMALAICMAASPIATLPMNVFAGTDTGGGVSAKKKFDVDELAKDTDIDDNTIYTIDTDRLPFKFGDGDVLDGKTVKNPGIVYAKDETDNVEVAATTYIIADIDGILHNNVNNYKGINTAYGAANYAANYTSNNASKNASNNAASIASYAYNANTYDAASFAAWATYRATICYGDSSNTAYTAASNASYYTNNTYNAWAGSYRTNASGVVNAIIGAYNGKKGDEVNKAWVIAAYAAARAAQKMSDGKGLDLEAKLKIAHMAYRIAEATWTQLGSNETNRQACKTRADALQEVIDNCYKNKVGDIEAQATQQAEQGGGGA